MMVAGSQGTGLPTMAADLGRLRVRRLAVEEGTVHHRRCQAQAPSFRLLGHAASYGTAGRRSPQDLCDPESVAGQLHHECCCRIAARCLRAARTPTSLVTRLGFDMRSRWRSESSCPSFSAEPCVKFIRTHPTPPSPTRATLAVGTDSLSPMSSMTFSRRT